MDPFRTPVAILAAGFAGCFVGWAAAGYLIQRLQIKHSPLYDALGKPQLFGSPFRSSTWRFMAFVALGIRFPRGDRLLTRAAWVFRAWLLLMPLMLLPLGGFVVCFFYLGTGVQLAIALAVSALHARSQADSHAA